jgi:hypothetical protein
MPARSCVCLPLSLACFVQPTTMQTVKGSRKSRVAASELGVRPARESYRSVNGPGDPPGGQQTAFTDGPSALQGQNTCKLQGRFEAADGTRTHDLLHGNRLRISHKRLFLRISAESDYRGLPGIRGLLVPQWSPGVRVGATALVASGSHGVERPRPSHRLTCATPREAAAGYSSQPKLIAHRSRARGAWRRARAPCPVSVRPFVVSATIHSPP